MKKVLPKPDGAAIAIEATWVIQELKVGDSLSVDGVCLTVTKIDGFELQADVSGETLKRTTLGSWQPGRRVNLERALTPTTRMGGHIVQGHVDATGTVRRASRDGDGCMLSLEVPRDIAKYMVEKGSIAVNGVSLTIAEARDNTISIAVIPHTFEQTNIQFVRPGDAVNIEVDILAKYVYKYLDEIGGAREAENKLMDLLEKGGYL